MEDLFGHEIAQTMNAGAEFSTDRKYRYALWRIWDKSKPLVMLIAHNPFDLISIGRIMSMDEAILIFNEPPEEDKK